MISNEEEKIIRRSFSPKWWNDVETRNSWNTFKIMSEFVQSYDKLAKIGPCVAIFGSARTKPQNKYYKAAVEIAERLTQIGFGVITGGGPGIMEAGNRGAKQGGGPSVGLNINLPFEQHSNPYIDSDKSINYDYFFVRKTIFMQYAQGFVVMPGGFGTLDELSEALTLIQTDKLVDFPIIFFGKEYWQGLIDWFRNTLLEEKMISPEDMDLFKMVDTPEEAVAIIEEFYNKYAPKPNF